ncbi:MAG: helix-hairpin-helix domain-containing protein [Planctomycetaceae bacterium]|nr:helix-hairpin-helix domain-containing protein [Planctomycetaceae bacterium]
MLNESLDISRVAADLSLPLVQVSEAIELLDAGNTVPFITRFRKDATGGLNETQLRSLQHRLAQLRGLSEKRQTILRALEKRGHLTEQLKARIVGASSTKLLEDLYQPFRYKRTSQVQQARELGLHPLAEAVYLQGLTESDFEHEVAQALSSAGEPLDRDVVLRGVKALLGEYFSNHLKLKQALRRTAWKTGVLRCQQVVGDSGTTATDNHEEASITKDDVSASGESGATPTSTVAPLATTRRRKRKKKRRQDVLFRAYFNFSEPLHRLPPYRILAINRGERSKQLRVKIELNETSLLEQMCREVVPESHPLTQLMNEAARELLTRSLVPALEREIRRELTEKAEEHAVKVFSTNLRGLLLQPPTVGKRVLAVDPGLKSGCTLAVIDQHGNFVAADKISIVGRDEKRQSAGQKILAMIDEHSVDVIVIGNGTGCRESEELIAKLLSSRESGKEVRYVIVNEAGASVYSTSDTGQNEFPNVEPTVRSAISIGRRLLDPLSELVKINPANIGVGLYQHDVKSKHLESTLAEVVESCVNYVGVDLNTASVDLLRYVAGLNQGTARRIIEYRHEHGPFTNRQQLLLIPGVGPATYVQCAGFLRISGGEQPLDATAIHPESYPIAELILESLGVAPADIAAVLRREVSIDDWVKKLEQFDSAGLSAKFAGTEPIGEHLKRDLLEALKRPGRDPRDQMPTPIFRKGILQVQDLSVGMALKGQVLNVVDFGVFVDIGIGESGLVHISNLAREYVRDPHQYFSVGDIVDVWVQSIDRKRGRVSLTAVDPALPHENSRESVPKDRKSGNDRFERPAPTESRARFEGARFEAGHRQAAQSHSTPKGAASQRRSTDQKSESSKSNRPNRNAPKYRDRTPNRDRVAAAPAAPITDGMLQGTEPMRSFSDLLQYAKLAAKTQQDT